MEKRYLTRVIILALFILFASAALIFGWIKPKSPFENPQNSPEEPPGKVLISTIESKSIPKTTATTTAEKTQESTQKNSKENGSKIARATSRSSLDTSRIECREGELFEGTCEDMQVCIDQGLCDHGEDPWENAICVSYYGEPMCYYHSDLVLFTTDLSFKYFPFCHKETKTIWLIGDDTFNTFRYCEDIDECFSNPCGGNSTCHNFYGGFECDCPLGYIYDEGKSTCVDFDECGSLTMGCTSNQTCTNTVGSYDCSCKEGYELVNWTYNGFTFCEIDNCLENPCGGNSTCINCRICINGYECGCPYGYKYDTDEQTCVDIDECELFYIYFGYGLNGCGLDQTCINTIGSYECQCKEGYESSNGTSEMAWSSISCRDIDECLENPCGENAVCSNTWGSFDCLCERGYELDNWDKSCREKHLPKVFCDNRILSDEGKQIYFGRHQGDPECVDIEHCLDLGLCGAINKTEAESTAVCIKRNENLKCIKHYLVCATGYLPTVHVYDEWKSEEQGSIIVKIECRNIDECEYGLDDCGGSSRCVDTDGSYECDCNYDNEWKYSRPNSYNETTRTCQKYDPCASSHCDQVCTNTDSEIWPFYECSCLPGYLKEKVHEYYDIYKCRIDETLTKICESDGRECQYKCVDDNLNGSKCLCPHGYTEVNGTCEDINECDYEFLDRHHQMRWRRHPGEICVNLHGSYQLFRMFDEENSLCPPDYRQSDSPHFSCELLADECPTDLPDCSDRYSFFTKEILNFTSPHVQFVGEIAPLAAEGQFVEHSFDFYRNDTLPEYMEMTKSFFIKPRNDTYAELYFNGTIPESDSNKLAFGALVIYTAKGQNDSELIRKEAFSYYIFTSKYDF